ASSRSLSSLSLHDALPIFGAQVEQIVVRLRRLPAVLVEQAAGVPQAVDGEHVVDRQELAVVGAGILDAGVERVGDLGALVVVGRSEEHTSELQSRENLLCR